MVVNREKSLSGRNRGVLEPGKSPIYKVTSRHLYPLGDAQVPPPKATEKLSFVHCLSFLYGIVEWLWGCPGWNYN